MSETSEYAQTPRTTLKRLPKRGVFDRAAVHAILDEGLVCHVGFAVDGQPFVIPTSYARVEDRLYLHGSAASRMLRSLGGGLPVAVTVTLLDGLVLARSTFHHSMNYRSVVVLGEARLVEDPAEKGAALEAIVEHVVPGRSRVVRAPSEGELRATSVLSIDLVEVSAKVRTGPPVDDAEDLGLACWAGVLPLRLVPGEPVRDPQLPADRAPSVEVTDYRRPGAPA
jgi:nitroimidazol reductase NimA-like FMN-containing flavoprotein (pyridoxamine 5'-phosphate oxidase superfamily)